MSDTEHGGARRLPLSDAVAAGQRNRSRLRAASHLVRSGIHWHPGRVARYFVGGDVTWAHRLARIRCLHRPQTPPRPLPLSAVMTWTGSTIRWANRSLARYSP